MYTQSFAVHFRAAHSDGEYDIGDRNQYERAIDDPRILDDPRVLQHRLANQEAARVLQDAAMANIAARVDSFLSDLGIVKAGVASLTGVVAPTSIGATIDKKLERACEVIIKNLDGLGRSIQTDLTESFDSLVQETNNRLDLMNARFDRLERGPRAAKRSSSSDAPSRRSPAKVARGLSSETVYDVDADTEEKEPASQDDDDDEDAQGDEAPKSMFPPAQAAEALPASPTPSATSTPPASPTPVQAPPASLPPKASTPKAKAKAKSPAKAKATSGPASLPPKASTPKAKAKLAWAQRRERVELEKDIKLKAEEAPDIKEQYDLVCTNWNDRTESLAAAKAKLAADPNDTAAKKSAKEFTELLKSIGKDKDALGAKLTLYELLEAAVGASKFLTDVNGRVKKENATRAALKTNVKSAAGVLSARKIDFVKAGKDDAGKDDAAKQNALKELEMAGAAHKKAENDAAKQSNVATAMLAQQSQTKKSVDHMIGLAGTVLKRLDAESIDADFAGMCADAKRDFVAFRKQVESFDADSVTL
ncbi:hypothetical protein BBJ28_00026919 [Nothophytophthora sp. Chile5]|nr:hypothetical protein BBJ28_00026919 [Nothophytophthora sp. Chile5]